MRPAPKKHPFFSMEAWIFLGLTLVTAATLLCYVDLTPQVGDDFFFDVHDPHYQADVQISKLFTRKDSQLIVSVKGQIDTQSYQNRIRDLTTTLQNINGIYSVKSLADGPKNLKDALDSPMWRRALIANNQESSNIIIILDEEKAPVLIPKIEHLQSAMESPDFEIHISGFPYISELIRRRLSLDLNLFSSLALCVFGLAILFIFHSWRILIGMIITCANAGALTFMINQLIGIKIGILTANLATIIFVLTLSHIIFLTFNWKHLHHPDSSHDQLSVVDKAVGITISASFWSMFTTLLGFLSLLLVPAQPLRELGISGAVGTLTAFVTAYTIFPAFLRLKEFPLDWSEKQLNNFYHATFRFVERNHSTIIVILMGIILVTSPKLWHLNTDPSMLSYFTPNSEIHQGLDYIDRNGGSTPMVIVIKDTQGKKLNTKRMAKRLWQLQLDLEQHQDVGTILSLPTLLSEGERHPFSFLISRENLLNRMDQARYEQIARSFITSDRIHGLFLIRMNEEGRTLSRLEVIDQLKRIVQRHGFTPHLVGGIYALQGHLSHYVAKSLIYGLGRLLLVFLVIAVIVARSLRIGLAMTVSISLVPLCILGGVGYFHIPLDIISAPASNVAIAMGIDAMIHMVHAYRRTASRGQHHLDDWLKVRRKMWEPIITSMLIICAGFGIFLFSSFPPTQRFGSAIVFGTLCAAVSALFIFPLLAKIHRNE